MTKAKKRGGLGPANDRPMAVKIEIRAAELAAANEAWGFVVLSFSEQAGWEAYPCDADPPSEENHFVLWRWTAGCLAREIVAHDLTQRLSAVAPPCATAEDVPSELPEDAVSSAEAAHRTDDVEPSAESDPSVETGPCDDSICPSICPPIVHESPEWYAALDAVEQAGNTPSIDSRS